MKLIVSSNYLGLIYIILCGLFFSTSYSSFAQGYEHTQTAQSIEGVDVTEFIFDETITKVGGDFYEYFYQNWSNPTDIEGLSIQVEEKPLPGMGAFLWISIEEMIVYQNFVKPGGENIELAAKEAIQACQSFFYEYEEVREQLESQDLSGRGVF
jgi:curli production assembly/transport component CsgE